MKQYTIEFDISELLKGKVDLYLNVYAIVEEKNSNLEYLSYSNIKIHYGFKTTNYKLSLAAVSIGGFILLILFIRSICLCKQRQKKRRLYITNRNNYTRDDYINEPYITRFKDEDDELLY